MQVTGTFPQLSDGYKGKGKSRRNSGTYAKEDRGMTQPTVGRAPRSAKNPSTLAGRRAASHRKAYGR